MKCFFVIHHFRVNDCHMLPWLLDVDLISQQNHIQLDRQTHGPFAAN